MIDANDSTLNQVDEFRAFVLGRARLGEQLSIDELYDEWRVRNPSSSELNANAKAIDASLKDLDSGEQGRDVSEFLDEFKQARELK